ncbi:MAG: polyamine ABC transporter substrate-binding protein [Chloroflexi bacterium]|nr:polyamine ABC transporter substrate-binding protein [Chloroflexota bacterium]
MPSSSELNLRPRLTNTWIKAIPALPLLLIAACAPVKSAAVAGEGSTTAIAVLPTSAPATQAHTGGILRIGQAAADLGTLDPDYVSGTQDRALVDMVFNGLLRYKPGDATVFEPDLATQLPTPTTDAAGKQVWQFSLRPGVMCHPSELAAAYELTSDDVLYSFTKAADKNTSAYASDYAGMTFAAPDPHTFTITLDKPQSTALFYPRVANYSGGYVVCRQAAEKLGPEGLKTHPVGTGPFRFKDYSPGEKVDLVANDAYFRGRPQLDGIEYRYMADLSSRELALRSGQLDLIYGQADDNWIYQMSSAPNVNVDVFGVGEVSTIYFNLNKPPFDNLAVRQAVVSALNRDEFLALYGKRAANKVFSPVPDAFMTGGLSEQELAARSLDYGYDPARARRLLAEAGLENGFEFNVVASEMPAYRVIYESLQAQLARVGVKMNVDVVDHATMHDQIRKDVNPLVVYIAFRPTADVYLTQFFHSDSIVVTGKNPNTNFAHYASIDEQIDSARNEPDASKQATLWKQAQVQALQDVVAYPIQYTNQVYARSTAVDYGHDLTSVIQLYPGIDERTTVRK